MKDATLTIRLPASTRLRIEKLARREGRSLSQATERLIELGLDAAADGSAMTREAAVVASSPPLAGRFSGEVVPSLDDFLAVRSELSRSLDRRTRPDATPRR